jgi:glycosyltransferase involved in cell wall biosynthesis
VNILLINHYAGSPQYGMEYRPYYMAREWVKLGHRVTIVAASFSHLRQNAPDAPGDATEQWLDGIRYLWLKTPRYNGNGVGRVVNIFSFVAQLFRNRRRLLRESRPGVVIASSTYPLDNLPACRIARSCGAMLIYEVHDIWPLSPIELGGMSPWNPFIMLMQWAENFAYRNADHVVSILPLAESHMRAHGLAEGKFVHIPNGIDPVEWESAAESLPREHEATLTRLKEQRRFIVMYAGGHGVSNALDSFVKAAPLLRITPATLVLVGQGPEKARLQKMASELNVDNLVFLPPVPKTAMPALLALADVLYLGWARTPLYRFGIGPNKLLDYMMAARPVIHAVDAGNDLVAESGCGLSCAAETPAAIAAAVTELMQQTPAARDALGQRGREYVIQRHSYSILANQFLAVTAQSRSASEATPGTLQTDNRH